MVHVINLCQLQLGLLGKKWTGTKAATWLQTLFIQFTDSAYGHSCQTDKPVLQITSVSL